MMSSRRELRFDTLDDAVRDVEHLLAVGYEKAGNWDLAQCCGHLADWVAFPMDGFPRSPLPVRVMMFVMRNTVAPRMARKAMATGVLGDGLPTIPQTVHAPGGDPAAEVARFRDTVARFARYDGPLHPSPLAGAMDKPTVGRLHALHAAHHLSFLVPKTAGA